MSRKQKSGTNILQYLEAHNAWDAAPERLAELKKIYWKEYKKSHRQKKRQAQKSTTVYLSVDEYIVLLQQSEKHKRSLARTIKEMAFCYIAQRFLVPDILLVNQLKETLTMNYCAIQKIFEENRVSYDIGKILLERVEAIEKQVLQMMEQPVKE